MSQTAENNRELIEFIKNSPVDSISKNMWDALSYTDFLEFFPIGKNYERLKEENGSHNFLYSFLELEKERRAAVTERIHSKFNTIVASFQYDLDGKLDMKYKKNPVLYHMENGALVHLTTNLGRILEKDYRYISRHRLSGTRTTGAVVRKPETRLKTLFRDLMSAIRLHVSFKTPTLEYDPKTGNVYVKGELLIRYDPFLEVFSFIKAKATYSYYERNVLSSLGIIIRKHQDTGEYFLFGFVKGGIHSVLNLDTIERNNSWRDTVVDIEMTTIHKLLYTSRSFAVDRAIALKLIPGFMQEIPTDIKRDYLNSGLYYWASYTVCNRDSHTEREREVQTFVTRSTTDRSALATLGKAHIEIRDKITAPKTQTHGIGQQYDFPGCGLVSFNSYTFFSRGMRASDTLIAQITHQIFQSETLHWGIV